VGLLIALILENDDTQSNISSGDQEWSSSCSGYQPLHEKDDESLRIPSETRATFHTQISPRIMPETRQAMDWTILKMHINKSLVILILYVRSESDTGKTVNFLRVVTQTCSQGTSLHKTIL
jgi:hypothetical protein